MARLLCALLLCTLVVALPFAPAPADASADVSSSPLTNSTGADTHPAGTQPSGTRPAGSHPGTGAQTCAGPAGDAAPGAACGVPDERGGEGAQEGEEEEEAALQKRVQNFRQWLHSRGITLGGASGVPVDVVVARKEASEGGARRPHITLVATRDIPRGERIVLFSRDHMVHSREQPPVCRGQGTQEEEEEEEKEGEEDEGEEGREEEGEGGGGEGKDGGRKKKEGEDPLERMASLAAWLLRERAKGDTSDWAPYIALLPPSLPLSSGFSDESLDLAEDPAYAGESRDQRAKLDSLYGRCDASKMANATREQFLWAMAMVLSRSYASTVVGGGEGGGEGGAAGGGEGGGKGGDAQTGPVVFVPLSDLSNHGSSASWRHVPPVQGVPTAHADGGFARVATRGIRQGEEVLDSYGKKSNLFLHLHYGFHLDGNADDFYFLAPRPHDLVALLEIYIVKASLSGPAKESAPGIAQDADVAVEVAWGVLERRVRAAWERKESSSSLELAGEGKPKEGQENGQENGQEDGQESGQGEGQGQEKGQGQGEGQGAEYMGWLAEEWDARGRYSRTLRHLGLWPRGVLDPRILGVLAALALNATRLKKGELVEADPRALAVFSNVTLTLSWRLSSRTCGELLGGHPAAYLRAFVKGSKALQKYLRATLDQRFQTSLGQDRECLAQAHQRCAAGPTRDQGEGSDSTDTGGVPSSSGVPGSECQAVKLLERGVPCEEVVMAMKMRMGKKVIIQDVLDHLQTYCS